MRDVDAEVVDRAVVHDIQRQRHGDARVRVGASQAGEDVQRLVFRPPVLQLALQDDVGAAAALAAAPTEAASAEPAATSAAGPASVLGQRGRQVLREPQAEAVGRIVRDG